MENLLQEMGARIAARRKQLNMTQAALAEAIGVSTQTISSAECGRKALRPENIVKICMALNCSTDYILTGNMTRTIPETYVKTVDNMSSFQYQCLSRIIENYIVAISTIQD